MSSNTDTALDDDGKFPDWLELYNNGTDPVQLGGWMISDKPDLDSAWTFPPEAVIEAGEYLLLWASGMSPFVCLCHRWRLACIPGRVHHCLWES